MKAFLEARLREFQLPAAISISPAVKSFRGRPLLATTSSHLGKSTPLHVEVCRYIRRSMIDARRSGHVLLVATESAIEPWADRAAELFSVPIIWVRVGAVRSSSWSRDEAAHIDVQPCSGAGRDWIVTALADQVDCVFARPQGNMAACLDARLKRQRKPAVRIAIHPAAIDRRANKLAQRLMGHGAIGWYCGRAEVAASARTDLTGISNLIAGDWAKHDDEWLVHCTRSCSGPWPGQSLRQHQDELLLGGDPCRSTDPRTALHSLIRILRMRRLVASALTSARSLPVVCFSAVPLATLLGRRQYRSHLHRWDYEPCGIAIRKSAAIAAGFEPVIYGTRSERDRLSSEMRYRFQSRGETFDWTLEREWRNFGDVDLDQFDREDVRVFVRSASDASLLPRRFAVSVVGEFVGNRE